jgi:hypothetical protein
LSIAVSYPLIQAEAKKKNKKVHGLFHRRPTGSPNLQDTGGRRNRRFLLNTVSGIDEVRSTSSEGVSQVLVTFLLEKDVNVAAQEVRDRVNQIVSELPDDADAPVVEKLDPDATPILNIALAANRPVREITEYADKVLRRQLESVPGVGQVRIVGGRKRQINVRLDPVRLTGQAGYLSRDVDSLLSADSRTWSLGPSVSLPLSGYGLIATRVRLARAAREEAIANYRQAVLVAIRDVETSLAQIRYRAEQSTALGASLVHATTTADLTRRRYEQGVVSRFELLDAERTRLQVGFACTQILAQQHIASVRLIKALGGAWQEP